MNLEKNDLIKPIAIGYWKSENQSDLPDPKDFVVQNIPDYDRQLLLNYLAGGAGFISYLGNSFCRFACGIPEWEMGASCFTDGKYVWPEGLSHYIKVHNVWLPKIFIDHVKENYNKNSSLIDKKKMALHDFTWWKKQSSI